MSLKIAVQSLAKEIISFVRADFHLKSYLYFGIFTFGCIFLNYRYNFSDVYLRTWFYEGTAGWKYPLFYSTIYFGTAIPILFLQKDFKTLRNKAFYLKSLLFIVLYGFSIGFKEHREWFDFSGMFQNERQFLMMLINEIDGVFLLILPLFFIKKIYDRKEEGFYGLSKNSKHISAYLLTLCFILPFLIMVSYTSDFQSAYPQFRPWTLNEPFGLPAWASSVLFEISYAIDFLTTELLFRGALIIGMATILGRKAILPMVAMYASIHFGKPVVETISSVFGGYLLGVLAYQTRHIWGGVIAHIGIAISIEIMGLLHYYVLKT